MLADSINAIRPCVVQVSRTRDQAVVGSGFFVDADLGLVATAAHVAELLEGGVGRVGLSLAEERGVHAVFLVLDAVVACVDRANDVALLLLKPNAFKRERLDPAIEAVQKSAGILTWDPQVVEMDESRPRDGDSVAVSGYPLGHPALVTSTGIVASAWVQDADLGGTPEPEARGESPARFLIDASVNPGNSGGPVYRTDDARVIGMCVAYRSAPLGESLVPRTGEGGSEDRGGFDVVHSQNSGLAIVVPSTLSLVASSSFESTGQNSAYLPPRQRRAVTSTCRRRIAALALDDRLPTD